MNRIEAAAFTSAGTARENVGLPDEIFDGTINGAAMHQVVKAHLANQRQGTHSTKTRGFVVGGNQKPWRQKGTGRARQGSTRAPNWVGGGTVFGPTPRSYVQDIPRKLKVLARKSAFNARALEHALFVIDAFSFDAPKTARIRALLERLEIAERKVLILTDGMNRNVYLSGRNLPNVRVMPFAEASTYDLLWSHAVLVEGRAIGHALDPVAEDAAVARPKRTKRKAAAKTEEPSGQEEAAAEESAPKRRAPVKKKTAVRKRSPAKRKSARGGKASGAKRAGAAKRTSASRATKKTPARKKSASRPRRKEK